MSEAETTEPASPPTNDRVPPGTPPARGGRAPFGAALGVGLAVGCCICGAGAFFFEDTYATAAIRAQLAERGIECDERFAVDATTTLTSATIGPTSCTVAEGAIESFEILDPVTAELGSGLEPTAVHAGRVRMSLRIDPPVLRSTGFGLILEALSVPQRLGALVAAATELAGRDLPPIDVASIEVTREGATTAALAGVTLDGETPLHMRAERTDLPELALSPGAHATMTIAPLTAEATTDRVVLEGDLDVDATLPLVGSLQENRHFSVTVDDVDTAAPRYEVRF